MSDIAVNLVFNDTANTEIYTYCHTLSLHDALPISTSLPAMRRSKSRGRAGRPRAKDHSASRTSAPGPFFRIESMAFCADALRSEEHTSELQSLMRISYAVFCLKKKKSRYKQQVSEHHIPTNTT